MYPHLLFFILLDFIKKICYTINIKIKKGEIKMSELQKELINMLIVFDNDTLESMKPLLEKILDNEILKIDSNANLKEIYIYDKIDTLKSIRILNSNEKSISYEEVLKQLGIGGDTI